jgi:hypothetical protein
MSIQKLLKAPSDGRFKHFAEVKFGKVTGLSWARKLLGGQYCHRRRVVR